MAVYPRPPTNGLLSAVLILVAGIVVVGLWVLYRESRWAGRRWLRFAGGALFSTAAAMYATALAIIALSQGEYTSIALGVVAFLLAIGGVIGTLQAAKSEDVLNIETVAHAIAKELLDLSELLRNNYPTDESDDTSARSSLLAEIYRDTYRLRVLNVGRAMKRHALGGSDALLRVADSPMYELQIIRIANGLNRLASELREKNLE